MYLHKWNEALVDWVNCLSLTPKISDLNELENGLFFNLLLRNLIPSDHLSEDDLYANGLHDVFSYLEKEYPLYGVQKIELERDSRTVYISSLLLLLSVTKGKTPLYCSQLCKDLQHDSQVKIKCFLETCLAAADKLNHQFLKSIIEGDYVPSEEQSGHSPKRSVGVTKTPLKEFLESPRLTDKLSRDLRRLESEKEALQLEKLELEDDLRIEKEKREQLQENLSKKSEQVVKLREELLEYAQNVDELKKGDCVAVNPHKIGTLESELRESENYVKILVEERDMMNLEKSKLKEKQAALMDRIKKLETRALDSERSSEELQISLSQKEQELQEFKTHCCELKEKIQLLSTQHNVSLESDTSMSVINNILSSPFSEGERLSQAVVDLKLAEVEADNEKLKSQLDLTQEQSQNLRVQLEEVKDKLGKAKIAQEAAMAENTHIHQQLGACSREKEKISNLLLEANDKISILSETNTCINKDIVDLKIKVTELEDLHHTLDEKIFILEEELKKKQEIQNNLLAQLEEERLVLANSESKNEQLLHQMTSCMKEKEELQVSLWNASEKNSLISNEKSLFVKEISDLKHKLTVVEDSNIFLKNECTLAKKEMDEKQENFEQIKKQLGLFERENKTLKERFSDSENFICNLNDLLSQEKQKRCENEANFQKFVDRLETEVSIITQFEGKENLNISHDMSLADKLDCILNFLNKYHLSSKTDIENLKSENAKLEKDMLHLKECEQLHFKEKENCEKQLSDALAKINRIESHAAQLESNATLLTEQLTEKCSQTNHVPLSGKEKQELEDLRGDKVTYLDVISVKEEEINKLKLKISEEENNIQVLKHDTYDLVSEKNNFLRIVDELRTTNDKITAEKLVMENKLRDLLHWKSLCELPEARIKEMTHQKPIAVESDVKSSHDLLDQSAKPLNVIETLTEMDDKNYNEMLAADIEIKLCSKLETEMDINRHLGLENKFWQIIRSGEMLEIYMEKLEEKNQELTSKIAALWEVLPNVQLKCNGVFLSEGASRLVGKEAEQSKEVCIYLENMLIKMEKHKASLEQEKVHVAHRALLRVLNRIQFSFEGTLADEDGSQVGCVKKPSSGSIEEQDLEVSRSLEMIEDKFTKALEEVSSTAQIFQEVECRCSKAEDALGYLKSHWKIEKQAVSDIDDKNDSVNKNEIKVLKESYEEMVKAKLHLERIFRENQDELQECHLKKETLKEKVVHLTSQNNWLLNELDVCKSKLGSIRQETAEEIQKEYEKKLARVSQRLESAYKDDLEKFSQESERCRQLEECCIKYKHKIMDCQNNLSDMKSHNKSQQHRIEALWKKNALLEEKVYESQLNFGVGDINQSMSMKLNRSHSAENFATYFARGKAESKDSMKYPSENQLNFLNASTFSKESCRSNLPSGMGQVFCTEDEEGESFNATFLSDLKEGRCDIPHATMSTNRKTLAVLQEQKQQANVEAFAPQQFTETPTRRLNELMRRNTLCLPHMKSSYPAETQIQDPRIFSEDCLKIAYMKPGPPTPGKNRRSSLQGNEQITEHKIQSTPGRILSWFGRRRRSVWDAENIPDTPRMKQKGMLRRHAAKQEHDDS